MRCNHISGVMVSVFASSAVDHRFESRLGQTKDYKIGICCFSAKHAALRRKSKDWMAWNQDNVSEWGDRFICRLLFQWAITIKIQLTGFSLTFYWTGELLFWTEESNWDIFFWGGGGSKSCILVNSESIY
jgi:hypothetical protein